MTSETVRRRIEFFQMYDEHRQAPDDDFGAELVDRVNNLDRSADQHLLEIGTDEFLASYGDHYEGYPAMRLGLVRRSDLPRVQSRDEIRDLDLADNEGLMEVAHLLFFDRGVVGAEFNYRGPRATRLTYYLRERLPSLPRVDLAVLIYRAAHDQLMNIDELISVELAITRGNLSVLREAARDIDTNIIESIGRAIDVFEGDHIQLRVVGREPHQRRGFLGFGGTERARSLATDPRFRESLRVLKMKGHDTRTDQDVVLDLLKEQIVSSVEVAKVGRSRVVVTESMYDRIRAAYGTLRAEIDDASTAILTASSLQ